MNSNKMDLHVGLCGAGIGGLAAAIALCRAGAKVTVLEAASELGEIGAGIQMTPNVSRLLIKWGVADVIGSDLVEVSELNLRRGDGSMNGYAKMGSKVRDDLDYPWWVVHRAHLHSGLVKIAQKAGAQLIINSRIAKIDHSSPDSKVRVQTEKGQEHIFDLLIGSDGINSIVRKTLFPDVKPRPPTTNCAYRAIVPMEQIRRDEVTRSLVVGPDGKEKLTMEVWMAPGSYIISYPISGGKDFNMVLSNHTDRFVDQVEDVTLEEVRETYKDYDPIIKRVVDMIQPGIQRWPLLMTGPLTSWSNAAKTVVLMGDAAHSMTNHMAQGAATSIEDGAFLARCVKLVVDQKLSLSQAISVYERARMPLAKHKQEVSYLNGLLWMLPDGPAQEARDRAMEPELGGKGKEGLGKKGMLIRSPNLYADPKTILEVYGYDAERHADEELYKEVYGREMADGEKGISKSAADRYLNWFLREEYEGEGLRISSKL